MVKIENRKPISEGFRKIDNTTIDELDSYIIDQINSDRAYIAADKFKISVGTDSKFHPRNGGWSVSYANIIAFTFGNRGTHLIMKRETNTGAGKLSMFDRLWHEVEMTVELATWIRDKTGFNPEVHIDVNPKKSAGSNIIFETAKGYSESMGFHTEVKPIATSAMCAADMLVRNKLVL